MDQLINKKNPTPREREIVDLIDEISSYLLANLNKSLSEGFLYNVGTLAFEGRLRTDADVIRCFEADRLRREK